MQAYALETKQNNSIAVDTLGISDMYKNVYQNYCKTKKGMGLMNWLQRLFRYDAALEAQANICLLLNWTWWNW